MAKSFRDEEAGGRILFSVISEIMLICAVILLSFSYIQLPVAFQSALAMGVLFIGSLLCWRSFFAAQIILVLALLASQFVLLGYFDFLLIPFAVIDLLAIPAIARTWFANSE
jgi:hypothetical protein